jgi:predicted dehydrogenase
MEEFLRLLQRGRVRVEELISHRYPLENAPEAYRTIMEPGSSSLAVVLRYPAADARPDAPRAALRRRVELPSARPGRAGAIRLALVGAGNIARWAHLPVINKMDDLTLRAVYSASGARGKSYARRFGADYCCSDYQEILGDPDIDAVLIVTRNAQHAAQAAAALDAGKHVFVEKPMALTAEECRTLLEAVRRSGKQLMVGFNRRFAPFYVEQKRQLSRRTGPAVINCRVNSPGISGSYWMADPAIGGAILGEACHFTDLFCWLLDQEPRDVSAFSLPTGVVDPIGENNITAVFRFADGSIASLAYCTVGSRTSGGERVEVFAPAVAAQTENFKRLDIQAASVQSKSKMFADKGYAEQMRAFVGAIRSGTPPEAGVREGARSTIMCLRMLEAARTLERCDVAWEDAVG